MGSTLGAVLVLVLAWVLGMMAGLDWGWWRGYGKARDETANERREADDARAEAAHLRAAWDKYEAILTASARFWRSIATIQGRYAQRFGERISELEDEIAFLQDAMYKRQGVINRYYRRIHELEAWVEQREGLIAEYRMLNSKAQLEKLGARLDAIAARNEAMRERTRAEVADAALAEYQRLNPQRAEAQAPQVLGRVAERLNVDFVNQGGQVFIVARKGGTPW